MTDGNSREKWRALTAGGLFSVVGAMENGVWPILLPTISDDFGVTTASVAWLLVAFALGMAGTSLTAGRIGDVIGHKRVAIVGLVVEGAILLVIATVPVFWPLVALRFVQGIARATGLNSVAALVVSGFPPAERGKIIGTRAGLSSLGLMLGPLYAGLVAGAFGWRAVAVGIVALYAVHLLLLVVFGRSGAPRADRSVDLLRRLDWMGATAFLLAMSFLLLATRTFRSLEGIGLGAILIAGAAGLFFLAVRFERRSAAPVLDLGLFRSPAFTSAGIALIAFSLANGALHFLFPFFMQRSLAWSLSLSGAVLVSLNFVQSWASPLMGAVSDKVGARRVQAVGVGLMLAGLLVSSRLGPGVEVWLIVGILLAFGLSSSLFMPPNNKTIYASVPPTALGTASAVSVVGRYVGQSLGAAVGASLLISFSEQGSTTGFQLSMLALAGLVVVGVALAVLASWALGRRALAAPGAA